MNPISSILIISYNSFATTTGPCLTALLNDPDINTFEILVVDNASDAETVAGLTAIGKNHQEVQLIFNNENSGFAAANNQMLERAQGEVLILLNSDTIPPPSSLSRLVTLLREQPALGMIGPMTNAAGNEQNIPTTGDNPAALFQEGEEWCRHAKGSILPSSCLGFFCVVMTRGTYLTIGPLDEGFGRGFYEDTDYCQRALDSNIAMHIIEDVFIYHKGGGSFKNVHEGVRQLMRDNKARLLRKHPTVLLRHRRLCNLEALWHYVAKVRQGEGDTDLPWRFAVRLRQAHEDMPRNPLKRLFYQLKIVLVEWALRRAMAQ